ncbi:ABC-type antimicrobial peptide transport system, permease component [Candidatus Rhodobacter oscarellae]|uniref:ABC-type antimicrobial peptide transport system, permease component n=1 Tax=Candidatus Rhodobacter oscarellae TaxID=1675527 RepID=A0A0J9E0V7_9RHOB|nr:ABC transporter permease [Candidatus Rhodobacter lobularis]KMW56561.1 ABC-type antimicrobial peptide transport system, permease component [Candidatus Rhodobacter lobularis]
MTFWNFARKSALRKPLRSALLIVSVAMTFLIYGLTAGFVAGSQGTAAASDELLGVMNAAGRGQPLPMAYLSRIAALPGVADVSPITRLRGSVGDARNVVAVSAGDPDKLLAVSGADLGLTPSLIDALKSRRDKVLVGQSLAQAQGWKTGDSLTVTAFRTKKDDGSRDWRFEIAGIFEGKNASTDTHFILAQYEYINKARARGIDTVWAFALRPEPGMAAQDLAPQIDALFANSAAPTRTMSEKQFLSAFLSQYADVKRVITLVVGVSFVTLLMIVINTMVFALRERRFEIGVLKTLGFRSPQILLLVLAEALFVFVVGGAIGLVVAKLISLATPPALGLVIGAQVSLRTIALILLLGFVAGLLPALSAMRTPILAAFRTR